MLEAWFRWLHSEVIFISVTHIAHEVHSVHDGEGNSRTKRLFIYHWTHLRGLTFVLRHLVDWSWRLKRRKNCSVNHLPCPPSRQILVAMSRAFCIPGIVFLTSALVLSLLASISLPFLPDLDVVRLKSDIPNNSNLPDNVKNIPVFTQLRVSYFAYL